MHMARSLQKLVSLPCYYAFLTSSLTNARGFQTVAQAATAFQPILNNQSHTKSSSSSSLQQQLPSVLLANRKRQTQRFMSAEESDEVKKAKAAAAAAEAGEPTVFDKILSGEWSSDKVYEDERCYAFRDVNPQAPTHILLIPKKRDGLTQLSKARADHKEVLGHLMYVAGQIGQQECPNGFRIVVNDGKEGAQSVYHLHLHILGGRQLNWPPG